MNARQDEKNNCDAGYDQGASMFVPLPTSSSSRGGKEKVARSFLIIGRQYSPKFDRDPRQQSASRRWEMTAHFSGWQKRSHSCLSQVGAMTSVSDVLKSGSPFVCYSCFYCCYYYRYYCQNQKLTAFDPTTVSSGDV